MSPEIVVGFFVLIGSLFATVATLLGVMLRLRAEGRVATTAAVATDLAARFDDASELAKYIDARVEEKVKPIREQLEKVKTESHEMHDAVRAHFTQLWFWDQRGRLGPLPMLPTSILVRLGLGHLLDEPFGDTQPANSTKEQP